MHLVELCGTGEYFAMKAMDKSIMLNRNKVIEYMQMGVSISICFLLLCLLAVIDFSWGQVSFGQFITSSLFMV